MNNVVFSFVILTFNSDNYIEACLSHIDASAKELELITEVYVLDNGSIDGTKDILERFKFSEYVIFRPILLTHNTGTTFSRNIALERVTGSFIVVLDSDTYVNKKVLESLKNHLEGDPKCGLAVPRLVYPDGRAQLSVDQFPTIIHKIRRFFFLKKIESKSAVLQVANVDYAISAFWMIPYETLKEVGLLDENIFYSPEDVDYCIRIWKSGYKITYLPQYQAVHDAQEISRPKGIRMINLFTLSHLKGLLYLYVKHRFLFSGKKLCTTNTNSPQKSSKN